MSTGLWKLDSGLAAQTRRTHACAFQLRISDAQGAPE
jgi:hypothetical protein